MGSAPACEMAAFFIETQAIALALEAPIASAEMLVQDGSALTFPGTYMTELKMDNGNKIRRVKIPFLWLHGLEDDYVAIQTHGERPCLGIMAVVEASRFASPRLIIRTCLKSSVLTRMFVSSKTSSRTSRRFCNFAE
jgi:hypothetical protein